METRHAGFVQWVDRVPTDLIKFQRFRADIHKVDDVTSTTAEWLLEIGGLTVGTPDGLDAVERGHHLAAQVRSAAAAYRSVTACEATTCTGTCPLAAYDGGQAACRLAGLLSPDTPSATRDLDPQRASMLYVQALRAAATAVFHCRRHAHPTGSCWFSMTPTPLCGDVLAVTHRMGA